MTEEALPLWIEAIVAALLTVSERAREAMS